jgi:Flp pilus assembly protein TadD
MALVKANRTALLTMSALLAGCATAGPVKDATQLTPKSTIAGNPNAGQKVTEAEAEPAIDFDGALLKAQAQRKMGDLSGANRTLSQMVIVAPDDPRVLGEYGKTLVAQGRSDDALAFLERAIELQSGDWTLYSAQGVAYDQKSDFRNAQTAYARALALKPGEPTVLSNKALSHIQTGELDEAERLLQAAADAGGDYPRIASNLALVQSLKSSRISSVPVPAPAPEKVAESPVQQPSSPAPAAPATAPTPHEPAALVRAPVEITPSTASIPGPNSGPEDHSAEIPAPQPQPATAALRPSGGNPPVVRMQRVPSDPLAGPAAPRKTQPAKNASEKPRGQEAASVTATLLRPSLNPKQ